MRKNDLIQTKCSVLRILAIDKGRVLTIDCLKRNMPKWYPTECICGEPITEQELSDISDVEVFDIDALDIATRKIVHDRYTIMLPSDQQPQSWQTDKSWKCRRKPQ